MYKFQHFLRHTITLVALISEYNIAFDYWLWTPPGWPKETKSSNAEFARNRWESVLRTTLGYAVYEPLAYAFLTHFAKDALFWFLLGSYMQILAAHAAIAMIAKALEKVIEAHKRDCEPHMEAEEERLVEMNATENEKQADVSAPHVEEGHPDEDAEKAKKPLRLGPNCPHKTPLYQRLALQIPTFSAAWANAGLQVYARYLYTEDSETWLSQFSFGWTVIIFLIFFSYPFGKWSSLRLTAATNRKLFNLGKDWVDEITTRLGALLSLLVLRGWVRYWLGQAIFATFTTGFVLVGDVGTSADISKNATENRKKAEEGEYGWFWRWWPFIMSMSSLTFGFGSLAYSWHAYRRAKQK